MNDGKMPALDYLYNQLKCANIRRNVQLCIFVSGRVTSNVNVFEFGPFLKVVINKMRNILSVQFVKNNRVSPFCLVKESIYLILLL